MNKFLLAALAAAVASASDLPEPVPSSEVVIEDVGTEDTTNDDPPDPKPCTGDDCKHDGGTDEITNDDPPTP